MSTLKEIRKRIIAQSKIKRDRCLSFEWPSDTEHNSLLLLFQDILVQSGAPSGGQAKLQDGTRMSREGPIDDCAYLNENGDILFFHGTWYGGSPGDAYRQIFTLLYADGSAVESDFVDSCTQPSTDFFLWSSDLERLDVLERAVNAAMILYRRRCMERAFAQAEQSWAKLPVVASWQFQRPDDVSLQRLTELLSRNMNSWVGSTVSFSATETEGPRAGDMLFIAPFGGSLYTQHEGVISIFSDDTIIRLWLGLQTQVELRCNIQKRADFLLKYFPLQMADLGFSLNL
jgi:hypothetical protein